MKKYDYVKTQREDVAEISEKHVPLVRKVMKLYTRLNVFVYKKTKGRFMKHFPGGFPICIVTMTGKKSGIKREIPLIHLPHGVDKYIVASQGGMNKNPVWYYNIAANPNIEIMVYGKNNRYIATQITSDEKAAIWPHLLSLYPDFDEYQARTDRDIPVFKCSPE
ncbi:MAG: nitroreductase family deazaflavin-dependent oxidoreductase [Cellvibrionales bacterium]|nr:nitroreductase family deazaflavin-dependent oxidoreductase [Cellvibrionales bacterium]